MDEVASFGAWLRRRRRALDLTQADLAGRASCSPGAVRKLEADARRPSRELAGRLAEALGVPPGERAAVLRVARAELAADRLPPPPDPAPLEPPTSTAPATRPAPRLPAGLTSFVGRERELAEVRRRLGGARLLTLTGAGGVGKTRLALEVARAAQADYPDGVWLVELAALADAALTPGAVARALGVPEQAGRSPAETLAAWLAAKRALLVLDNCEHLLDACAALAEALLGACPRLTILTTSREPLRIGGELTWRVPSLSLPDGRTLPTPAGLAGSEAARLFLARAALARPGFALTERNAAAVAEVCRRLDGIPLALELAAARTRVMSVEQIAARLDDGVRLLTGGSRTALPRQQTLRATLDWSHALLTEPERSLFRRLAAFAGGWTLEAAEAMCSEDGIAAADVLDLLARLVDKSLVQVDEQGKEARYRLLETVRQFAAERLAASGEGERVHARHARFYLALAERAQPDLHGPTQQQWSDLLEVEHDNLRAALARWLAVADGAEAGLRLAGALEPFWCAHDYAGEGLAWLERALARREGTTAAARTRALVGASRLAWLRGDFGRAAELAEEGLALARQVGDRRGAAAALQRLALVVGDRGDAAPARALLDESVALWRATGDRPGLAFALFSVGRLEARQGDYGAARAPLEEAAAISRDLGDREDLAMALAYLGLAAARQGDYAAARARQEESLAIKRALGRPRMIAVSLLNLGLVARLQGDYAAARARYAESLTIFDRTGDAANLAWALEGCAGLAAAQGRLATAARLFGAAEALRAAIGAPMPAGFRLDYERDLAGVRAGLGEAACAAAGAEGRALALEEVIAEALAGEESAPT